jgi:predicted ATPase
VYLKTLGGLRLEGSALTRPKPLSLLVYLAFEGTKSRGHVRDLLWGAAADAAASLRMALKQLRNAGALLEKADLLGCAVPSDVQGLLEALDAGDDQKAVTLYTGAFLHGLDLGLPKFEEWLLTTSEFLAARVSLAHLRLAEAAFAQNNFEVATREAQAAYSVEGNTALEPEVLLRVLRVLELCGHDLAVLVRREAVELGLSIPNSKLEAKVSSLPVPLNQFLERPEQAVLIEYLQDNRLISIVGYGGAGKSRLALEVARALQTSFRVCFVALEAVMSSSEVSFACLRALGETEFKADTLEQLKHRIGDSKTLLVLDNFEHLLEFAPSLLGVLASCSALQVLVTSRERLNVLGEVVLPLSGFESSSTALEFLSICALRSGIKLELQNPIALNICDLLERYPLAIELAAALTPILSLPDIEAALREHLDILSATPHRDTRHNGMRAVFNWSWSLLSNPQRMALARLAVFKDGFARTAALNIIDSNLTMLIALLQKSLVQNQQHGRYRLHPLIAQYCLEALESIPLEQQKARSNHANFFLNWLEDNAAAVRSDKAGSVLSAFETDLENCKSAWLWLCENPDPVRFERLQDMVLLFDARARFTEGIRLFEAAINVLEPSMALAQSAGSRNETLLRATAILRINTAWLYHRFHNTDACLEHATYADSLLSSLEVNELHLKVLNILGTAATLIAKFDLALQYYIRSADLAKKLNLQIREAIAWQNAGHAYSSLGQYENAVDQFLKAREVYITLNQEQNLLHLNMSVVHLMIFCTPFSSIETQKLLNESLEKALLLGEINVAQWFYICNF